MNNAAKTIVRKSYQVTEKAGAWVAGRRSPGAGKTLQLSAEEAHYALLAGELRDPQVRAAAIPEPVVPKARRKGDTSEGA